MLIVNASQNIGKREGEADFGEEKLRKDLWSVGSLGQYDKTCEP